MDSSAIPDSQVDLSAIPGLQVQPPPTLCMREPPQPVHRRNRATCKLANTYEILPPFARCVRGPPTGTEPDNCAVAGHGGWLSPVPASCVVTGTGFPQSPQLAFRAQHQHVVPTPTSKAGAFSRTCTSEWKRCKCNGHEFLWHTHSRV